MSETKEKENFIHLSRKFLFLENFLKTIFPSASLQKNTMFTPMIYITGRKAFEGAKDIFQTKAVNNKQTTIEQKR
ncbi:MAG: hypothetical protein M5T52_20715 [Ignavibacteriaceae bacterium]|nr:hypothetical protein [Ignavibacteriaceae bacterium]